MSSHLHAWETPEEVANEFGRYDYNCTTGEFTPTEEAKVIIKALEGAELLFSYYTCEDDSGTAMLIYAKDGKLYEVNGAHCSCDGLEGQWEPEETDINALLMRKPFNEDLAAKLSAFLEELEP